MSDWACFSVKLPANYYLKFRVAVLNLVGMFWGLFPKIADLQAHLLLRIFKSPTSLVCTFSLACFHGHGCLFLSHSLATVC